jgi:hypothetical protein
MITRKSNFFFISLKFSRIKMLTNFIVGMMLLTAVVSIIPSREVTISNVIRRRDTSGNILDAHDGSVFPYDDLYYY